MRSTNECGDAARCIGEEKKFRSARRNSKMDSLSEKTR